MKRVSMDLDTLSVRSRLTLFYNTKCSASKSIAFEEEDLNYETFLANGVKAVNLMAAGIMPTQLKTRGFDSSAKLKHFGFDALHLVDSSFCNQMLLAYGRDDVVENFLVAPQDAVSLAGSQAVMILKISTRELLEACVGFPSHSFCVLKQLPLGSSLNGVPASLLLDAGLRLHTLAKVGYTIDNIIKNTNASPVELQKLGFSLA